MSFMPFTKTILRNLVKKPATRKYPIEKREPFAAARGHIAIDIEACIFCGACMRKCPTRAIATEKPGRTWQIDRLRCIQCSACVGVCPKKCLFMQPQYSPPSLGQQVDWFHLEAAPSPTRPASAADALSKGEAPAGTVASPTIPAGQPIKTVQTAPVQPAVASVQPAAAQAKPEAPASASAQPAAASAQARPEVPAAAKGPEDKAPHA